MPELKGLKYPTSDSPRITIRHLLSHAEGFPEDNPWGDRQLARTDDELSQMLRGGIPFSTSPGTAYEYSNYGFAILGRIVSSVSGMRYDEYVTTNILRPLGMTSTTLEASTVPAGRLAHGYRWEDNRWKDEPLLPHGAFGSMGGMLTSVRDLGRYVGALLSAWPPRDGPETAPVRRASLREMQQVWRPAPASVTRTASDVIQLNSGGYGFGLRDGALELHGGVVEFFLRRCTLLAGGASAMTLGHVVLGRDEQTLDLTRDHERVRRAGEVGRVEAADAAAVTGARRGARRGVAARRSLGRQARRRHRRGESVSRRVEGSSARRPRARARFAWRLHATDRIQFRRKCAARLMDDELRARQDPDDHHARADDATEGSVAPRHSRAS